MFLFVIVKVFSRFLWERSLKDNKAQFVIDGVRFGILQQIIKTIFLFLKKNDINFLCFKRNPANFAERYFQTLKKRLHR